MERGGSHAERALLEEQSPWVHAFARRIVRDPHGANDIAQEALLAALLAPPPRRDSARELRAWLGSVTVNLARRTVQRGSRRAARERRAARDEALPSTLDAMGRAAVHDVVVQAVAKLDEPYRTAIRLRYFENVPIAEIARRTGTGETRVRKWLWRGRALLRAQLERSRRDRGPRGGSLWLSSLLGVRWRSAASRLPSLAGPAAVHAALVALLIVLGLGAAWWSSPEHRLPSGSAALEELAPGSSRSPLLAGAPDTRRPAGEPRPRTLPALGPERTFELHRGSVVDLLGRPVRDARVVDERGSWLGTTDPGGRFAARLHSYPARLGIDRKDLTLVRAARVRSAEDLADSWIVAAPAVGVSGWVVDPDGLPLEGATVFLVFGKDAFVDLPVLLSLAEAEPHATRTGKDGGFDLPRIPAGRELWIEARHPAAGITRVPVPASSVAGLVLSFERRDVRLLAGTVEDELGVLLPGAWVGTPEHGTWTDARGGFELWVPRARATTLAASKPTFETAYMRIAEGEPGSESDGPQHVRMVVGGRSSGVHGVVLGPDGRPTTGGRVFACTAQATSARAPLADPRATGSAIDEAGTFAIGGLSSSVYELVAWDPGSATLAAVHANAGDGAALAIQASPTDRERVLRVVDSLGRPLAGARVEAQLHLATEAGSVVAPLAAVRADADGSFRFVEVPEGLVQLRVQHPDFAGAQAILALPARGDATLRAEPLVTLDLLSSLEGDVCFFDEAGDPLALLTPAGPASKVSLRGGRSGCVGIATGARSLELRTASGASLRLSLALVPSASPLRIDLR
jgi:RNA polymerase sigma-70 factor (ECF subfamily)